MLTGPPTLTKGGLEGTAPLDLAEEERLIDSVLFKQQASPDQQQGEPANGGALERALTLERSKNKVSI